MARNFVVANLGPDKRKGVPEIWATLKNYGDIEYREIPHPTADMPGFLSAVQEIDVIICGLEKITAEMMGKGVNLKAAMKRGVGYDNFDLEAATKLGIHVVVGSGNHYSVAEAAVTLMLSCARNLMYWHRNTVRDNNTLGIEMYEKTLGCVGFGRIGNHVAKIAGGLGMNVIVYDPFVPDSVKVNSAVRFVEFDALLKESDVITLHCPLSADTRNLIGMKELKKMKPTAILVNTARGGLINEQELAQAVQEGVIAGAGVDVLVNENNVAESPLIKVDKIIVTPHKLIGTAEVLQRVIGSLRDSVVSIYKGQIPESSVNKGKIAPGVDRILNMKK